VDELREPRQYEVMFIIKPDLGAERTNDSINQVVEHMESNGCQVKRVERWGIRRLAYEIKKGQKFREGYYVIIIFDCDPQFAEPFKRWLMLRDEVLRVLLVRSEADPTKPIKPPTVEVLDVYEEELTPPQTTASSQASSQQSEKEG